MKRDALDKMTVKDLRELASKKKISGAVQLTKAQLVKSLVGDTASKTEISKSAKKSTPVTKKKTTASASTKTAAKKSTVKSSTPLTKKPATKTKSTKTATAEKKVKPTKTKVGTTKASKTKVTATGKKSEKIAATPPKPKPSKDAVKKITTSKKSVATKPSTRTRKRLSSTAPKRKSPTLTTPTPETLSASSLRLATAPAPVHAPAPPVVKGADPGLPIPEHYGRDRLVLMVQDPHHVFAYWELQSDTVARVTNESHGGDPVLIIYINGNPQTRDIDLRGGNYYLAVAADQEYEAELALRSPDGNLHLIVRSNKVRTPAPNVSSRVDEQWMGVDESFHELLELAGLPGTVSGAGSVARLRDQSLSAWGWQQGKAPSLSSTSLSSHSLSSRSRLAKKP